jgi:hypothetical protein
MRVLVLCIHYPVASGRYIADALRRMGHDVKTSGQTTGNDIWGIKVDPQYVWVPDNPTQEWEPDLVIVADSAITLIKADLPFTAPIVVWGVDSHVRDYRGIEADHLFLAHGHGLRMGEENVTWLPCAYDPEWFTPSPIAWADRRYDATLAGVMYASRLELVHEVLHIPNVKVAYGMGAIYDAYRDVYHNTRVSLVRSAAGDVAQRVWETAAMGCLVLMDDCPDCEALGLVDGVNCLIYHSTADAVDKLRWVMAHPEEAEAIAQAGQAWAKPGTWDARAQVIIDWVEQRNAPKRARKQKAVDVDIDHDNDA